MPVNFTKKYLTFVQTVTVFLPLKFFFKMAAINPILKKKISNLKFISFFVYIFRKSWLLLDFRKPDPLYYLPIYFIHIFHMSLIKYEKVSMKSQMVKHRRRSRHKILSFNHYIPTQVNIKFLQKHQVIQIGLQIRLQRQIQNTLQRPRRWRPNICSESSGKKSCSSSSRSNYGLGQILFILTTHEDELSLLLTAAAACILYNTQPTTTRSQQLANIRDTQVAIRSGW